jgi:predicted PurR-regulated permease PerM
MTPGRAGAGLRAVAGGPRRPIGAPPTWLAVVGVAALAYLVRGLLLPMLVAAALAYLLNPLVTWAEGLGVRRRDAVAVLFLGLLGLAVGGAWFLGPHVRKEVGELIEELPTLTDKVDAALVLAGRDLAESVPVARRYLPSPEARRGWIDQLLEGRGGHLSSETLGQAGHLLLFAVLVPFFAFFFLRDTRRLARRLLDRVPAAHIETSVAVWCEIDRIIGRYLRGIALDGIVVAVLASLGLLALGVPYPLLLGGFAGLANAVPIVGPLLGASAAGLVVLADAQGLAAVANVLGLFVVLKLIDDTVIQPLTIGRSVHLHPVLLIASVIAGSEALGILGMIVAVPVATIFQETIRLWLEHRRALAGHGVVGEGPTGPSYFVC